MCADYGFRSGAGRLYQGRDGEVPEGVLGLVRWDDNQQCPALCLACHPLPAVPPSQAKVNFSEELEQLRLYVRFGGKEALMEVDVGGEGRQDDRPAENLLQKVRRPLPRDQEGFQLLLLPPYLFPCTTVPPFFCRSSIRQGRV